MPAAFFYPGGGELFGVAAALDELALELLKLAVQKVIGLVDQADHRVGGCLGGGFFDGRAIGGIGRGVSRIRRIRPIGRIRLTLANCPHLERARIVLGPDVQSALTQVVFVVQEQLVKAGACDANEPEFGLAK